MRGISICFLFIILYSCSGFDGKDGTNTTYYDGTKQIMKTVEYKNGKKNGYYTEYYRTGQISSKQFYVNDTIQDTSISYYENGKTAAISVYKNGKRNGTWKKFNKNGMLYLETNYADDVLNGRSLEFTYQTGKPLKRYNYIMGVMEGKQELFYNNGKPKSISYYKSTRPTIGLEEFYESGKKKNNDFKINVTEINRLQLEGRLRLIVTLENPQEDDAVYEGNINEKDSVVGIYLPYLKKDNQFETDFQIPRGGYVMKTITILAYRKTSMGNTYIKSRKYIVSANNY